MILDEYRKYLNEIKAEKIEEKVKEFKDYLNNNLSKNTVHDELVDFIDLRMNRTTRWESFARYIETRYDSKKYNNVLDVGAGRTPLLSFELQKKGYNVTAMDPKLEHTEKIDCIKALFDYEKTSILEYDLLVGLEPCMATEHIVRSAILNDKPFAISLCAAAHDSIFGKKIKDMDEWWNYLVSITDEKAYIDRRKVLGKEHIIIRNK